MWDSLGRSRELPTTGTGGKAQARSWVIRGRWRLPGETRASSLCPWATSTALRSVLLPHGATRRRVLTVGPRRTRSHGLSDARGQPLRINKSSNEREEECRNETAHTPGLQAEAGWPSSDGRGVRGLTATFSSEKGFSASSVPGAVDGWTDGL